MENLLERNEEFQRDEIIANALTANTSQQIQNAEQQIIEWMRGHPRDFGMLDAGEQLVMMSERYNWTAEELAASVREENE